MTLIGRGMSHAAADLYSDQLGYLLVHQTVLAVRQSDKALIHQIQLFLCELKAEILAPVVKSMTTAMFAQHQLAFRNADAFRIHDFVSRALLQISVLMDAGF